MTRFTTALLFVVGVTGCSGGTPNPPPGLTGDPGSSSHDPDDPFFANLPQGAAQLSALCARGHQDLVSRGICAKPTPSVSSLSELEHVVGLFSQQQPPQFALTGHSTSLIEMEVSAINPRAIVFTAPSQQPTTQQNDGSFIADPGFLLLAFARGGQFVEIAAHDPEADEINFYLARFTHTCNSTAAGCGPGDLLTPSAESDWQTVTVYDDEDLKDTVFDCRACHQPDSSSRKILRMQERRQPWTHWFRNNQNEPGGEALFADFTAAHGTNEDYASIPAGLLGSPRSDPLVLEALIDNNTLSPQPNEFNSQKIGNEMAQDGQSPTWSQLYANFVAGSDIPVPFPEVRVTDPAKLANMTAAYQAFAMGGPASSLPDIRDVIADANLADLGQAPQAGSTGQSILTQMCQRCHNPNLDQTISRSHFDVTQLATLPTAEKVQAVNRMMLPKDSPLVMPPVRAGSLTADELSAAAQALE